MLLTAAQLQKLAPRFCICLAQTVQTQIGYYYCYNHFFVVIVIVIIVVVNVTVIITVFTTTITNTMAAAAYLMYSPGRQLKVLRAYSMSSSFSAK